MTITHTMLTRAAGAAAGPDLHRCQHRTSAQGRRLHQVKAQTRRSVAAPSDCHRMSRVYRCKRRPTVRADDFTSLIERTLTGSNQP